MPRRLFALVLALTLATSLSAAEKPLRAGASVVDITPKKFPVPMSGSMVPTYANQAHDPLNARCLVVDDGQTKIAIVVVDACAILRDICDEAKAIATKTTGIPTDHISISATHTHSAVTAGLGFQAPDMPADYRTMLIANIARSIKQANDRLEPAQVGWGSADEPRHVFNRRWILKEGKTYENPFGSTKDRARMNPRAGSDELDHPAGPTDPQVSVLAFRSPDGRPICILANYSLHYVGGMPAGGVSADYFGAFATVMNRLLKTYEGNPGFVVILSNGTSGNINNGDFFHKLQPRYGPYEKIYIVANDVAVAKDILSKAKRREDGAVLQLAEVYANETVNMAGFPSTVNAKLQAIRIGELGIATIPCEVFVEIGLDLKQRSPLKPMFTIELANGCNGYLPTAEQHKLGGYETWRARSAYLAEDSAEKITHTVLDLLKEVSR
jgi:hypothetical protein